MTQLTPKQCGKHAQLELAGDKDTSQGYRRYKCVHDASIWISLFLEHHQKSGIFLYLFILQATETLDFYAETVRILWLKP